MHVTVLLTTIFVGLSHAHHQQECTSASHVGRWWYNACEERCVCEEHTGLPNTGTEYLWECYRERKEFTCMSTAERERFIDTFKTISTAGHPLYAQYQDLVGRHSVGFGTIHTTDNFLPWHRWFARALEDLLRHVDCRVTLPWWRWSKKSANPFTGSPFLNSMSWLGTDGVPSSGNCVQDGPFASPGWTTPNSGCLKRNFGGSFPAASQITTAMAMTPSNFGAFSDFLEVQLHNSPHGSIGGTMVTGYSPDAPEFFMHHGYIDQLWDRWQKQSSTHLSSYNCGSCSLNTPMEYAQGATPADVIDLKATNVMYVSYSKNTAGSGHWSLLPSCMLIKVPWIADLAAFSILDLENALIKNVKETRFVPQLEWKAPSDEEQRRWEDLVLKSENGEKVIEQLRAKFKTAKDHIERVNNELEDVRVVGEFDDESSNAAGYDVAYVAKAFGVQPLKEGTYEDDCQIGEEWDARKLVCVPISCESKLACPRHLQCIPNDNECECEGPCPQFVCRPRPIQQDTPIDVVRPVEAASAIIRKPISPLILNPKRG